MKSSISLIILTTLEELFEKITDNYFIKIYDTYKRELIGIYFFFQFC